MNPILAFQAGVFGVGMGYVYVGRMRYAIAVVVAIFGGFVLFAFTRLIVYSAGMLWFIALLLLLISGVALFHPVVLAIKRPVILRNRYNRWWWYATWIIFFDLLGYLVAGHRSTFFGYEPFRISSVSMSPTVELNEFVMTDTWRFKAHAPVVGDVVILERPENAGVKYIKRVVAVGGDRLELHDGVLYRNGQAADEPYEHTPISYGGSPRNIPVIALGPEQVYVLGDFRDNSMDSRQWGPLLTSTLRGRVNFIWLSIEGTHVRWDRIGTSLLPQQ